MTNIIHIQSVLLLLNIRAKNCPLYQNLCHSLRQNRFYLKRENTPMIYHQIKSFKKFVEDRYLQKSLKVLPSTLFSVPARQSKTKSNYNLQRPQIFKSSKTLWMCLKRIFRHSNLFLNFEYRNGCDLATVTVSVQHHYVPSSGPLPTFTS